MIEGRRTGQDRPVEYQLAAHVRQAVQKYISYWPEVELITQGRNSVEPEAAITIILMSGKDLPPEFEEGLVSVVHKIRGDKPVVRIFSLRAARQQVTGHQSDTNPLK